MPTAVQASDFRLKIRKATQTDSPVAARPRWVKMIGTGSLLRATPWLVTSFSISHTASMNSPMRTVANQVITVAKPMFPPAPGRRECRIVRLGLRRPGFRVEPVPVSRDRLRSG